MMGDSLGAGAPAEATMENSGTPGGRIGINPTGFATFAGMVLRVTITKDTDPPV